MTKSQLWLNWISWADKCTFRMRRTVTTRGWYQVQNLFLTFSIMAQILIKFSLPSNNIFWR